MPRATYRGASRGVHVYIIERGHRGASEHGGGGAPLAGGLGRVAEAQFDSRSEGDVHPAFAEVAAFEVRAEPGRRRAENPRLFEHRPFETWSFRRGFERQAGQAAF